MKLLTDTLKTDVGGQMPLWVLITIALAAAAGIWALCQIGRDAQEIHEKIEDLRARAQRTDTAHGLRELLRELADLIVNQAWHRYHHMAARQVQFYIEGRLSVIDSPHRRSDRESCIHQTPQIPRYGTQKQHDRRTAL